MHVLKLKKREGGEEFYVWMFLLAIFVCQDEFRKRNVGRLISLTNVEGFTAKTWICLVRDFACVWRVCVWAVKVSTYLRELA